MWHCRGPGAHYSKWTGLSLLGCSPSYWCGSTGCGRGCQCTRTWRSWCGRQSEPLPQPGENWWHTGCHKSWRPPLRCALETPCPNSAGLPVCESLNGSPGEKIQMHRLTPQQPLRKQHIYPSVSRLFSQPPAKALGFHFPQPLTPPAKSSQHWLAAFLKPTKKLPCV